MVQLLSNNLDISPLLHFACTKFWTKRWDTVDLHGNLRERGGVYVKYRPNLWKTSGAGLYGEVFGVCQTKWQKQQMEQVDGDLNPTSYSLWLLANHIVELSWSCQNISVILHEFGGLCLTQISHCFSVQTPKSYLSTVSESTAQPLLEPEWVHRCRDVTEKQEDVVQRWCSRTVMKDLISMFPFLLLLLFSLDRLVTG